MRSSKILAAVLALILVAGASVPFGSYVPSYSLTAVVEDKIVGTDDLAFTVFADHADIFMVLEAYSNKCGQQ